MNSPSSSLSLYLHAIARTIIGDDVNELTSKHLTLRSPNLPIPTTLLPDGLSHRLIFDESVQIKQLDVVEQHGILLFRAGDKGKESSVYVFRLREFESDASARCAELFNDRENDDREKEEEEDDEEVVEDNDADRNEDDCDEDEVDECDDFTRATAKFQPVARSRARVRFRAPAVRSRAHIKERKLRRTRGCHLYSITRPGGSHLRMVMHRFFPMNRTLLSVFACLCQRKWSKAEERIVRNALEQAR